jgi:phenylalanyl-tRNA synthetase beta chain
MKFSYQWLYELVDGARPDPVELGRTITMKTAECEGVEPFAPHLARVAVARILSAEPIPGSHNQTVIVDAGEYGRRTVVCGAPNCRAGITTIYVPPETTLGALEIKTTEISGVRSEGMLASGEELGINRDHSGILELDGDRFELKPDWIIEIDNKSLTHRPDLWGHHGMAREVAAITGARLLDPVHMDLLPPADGTSPISVVIENYGLTPRYSALVFDNVKVQPSPVWLQYRLEAVGLNAINNIVDVTNYVMAELAQPMHAFDADKLHGDVIYARPGGTGERIHALNGEWYDLGPSNIVIADRSGPIAIGGVIGGSGSAISEPTTRIVLESANFQASSIRKTSSALKLRTDASMRFEKAQDPLNTTRGLARAIELLRIVSPGIRIVGGIADAWIPKPAPQPILLPLDWLDRKLGRAVPASEVRSILQSLEFGVDEIESRVFSVTVPSWRATKDVSMKDDLVEEVGRMIGYDTVAPKAPLVVAAPPPANEDRAFQHRVRETLVEQGFTEVYNYSFVSEDEIATVGLGPSDHVRVANPIAADQQLMRRSLLPGILRNIRTNAKNFDEFRFFEIGHEIQPRQGDLPLEAPHVLAVIFTPETSGVELFELKRVAQCLARNAVVEPAGAREYEHPARTAVVCAGSLELGRLFEFHPSLIEGGRAGVLDLDLQALHAAQPRGVRYRSLRRFPSSAFDLSVLAPSREQAGVIEARMAELAGPHLLSIEFLRQYEGAPLPAGTKSVSYRLTVGAPDRTFSSDEVAEIRAQVIEGMRKLGYKLRI